MDQACSPLKLQPIQLTEEIAFLPVSAKASSRAMQISEKEAELEQLMAEITSLRMARTKQAG